MLFDALTGFFNDMAIDLGTANTWCKCAAGLSYLNLRGRKN
jgi:hypothetical protein